MKVLVGSKSDLRESNTEEGVVRKEEGEKMAVEIGACGYVEISSLKSVNLLEPLQLGLDTLFADEKKNGAKCLIM
jgi:hypothetical protein